MKNLKQKLKNLFNINLTSVSKKLKGKKFKIIKKALAVVFAVFTGGFGGPEININFNVNATDDKPGIEDSQAKENEPTVVNIWTDNIYYDQLGEITVKEFSDGTVKLYSNAFTGNEEVFEERFPNGVINYYGSNSEGGMYLSAQKTPTSVDSLYTYTTFRTDGSVLKELIADEREPIAVGYDNNNSTNVKTR